MTTHDGWKRTRWPLASIIVLCFAAYTLVDNFLTKIKVSFAQEQTAMFDEMREKAERSSASEAAAILGYVVSYYPSGTKQSAGSPLDRVVERARKNAVREIIAVLRTKTGRDFGDRPIDWVEALRRPESR